jgi:predicted ABC-type ATPase
LNRPVFRIIAGPNGAGKSTFTSSNQNVFGAAPLFDPDEIAKTIQATTPGLPNMKAGRIAVLAANKHLRERKSFGIETTLSGNRVIRLMEQAREAEFEIQLVYFGTESVEINLARVAQRVRAGGHSVPEEDVRRRYEGSLNNLPEAIGLADEVFLFDNSGDVGYELIAYFAKKRIWWEPVPAWAASLKLQFPDSGQPALQQLKEIIKKYLLVR